MEKNTQLWQAILAFFIFCGLSLLSRVVYPIFGLVVVMGITLPLIWGKTTGNWSEIGFTTGNWGGILRWGIIAGILTSLIGLAVLPQRVIPSSLGMQLIIGLPMWALIISPFQEFFFRGWLQTRFENALGDIWGLIIANMCFTLWHYCAPFVSQTSVPLESITGALSTFGAGLIYAYAFQRTKHIATPWLAHLLAGLAFIIAGAMDFTSAVL